MNTIIKDLVFDSGKHISLIQGDITEEPVEAIVNAANAHLQHGGGVAAAIARRGGPQIQIESEAWVRKHGPVSHSKPAYTNAGNLPCRYVIHAVGAVWGEGDEDRKLKSAIIGSLQLGDKLGITSISFPAISTGIFGFPLARAAEIILDEMKEFIVSNYDSSINIIRLALFDQASVDVFSEVWELKFDTHK
jgi:O-acetyl-ADP-ribose deacetylase (regulator of RNase III)